MDRSYSIWTISQLKLLKLVKTHQASSLGRTRVAKQGLSKRQLLLLPSYLIFNAQRKSGPGREPPSLSWDIYHLPPCGPGFLSWLLERAAQPNSRWPSLASAALERVWSVCPLYPTLNPPQGTLRAWTYGVSPGLLRCWRGNRGWRCSLWRRPEGGWGPGSGSGPPCGLRPGPGPASPCREHAAGAGHLPPASSLPYGHSAGLKESIVSGTKKRQQRTWDTPPTFIH